MIRVKRSHNCKYWCVWSIDLQNRKTETYAYGNC